MTTAKRQPGLPRLPANMTELCGNVRVIRFFDGETGAVIATLTNGQTIKGEADGAGLELGTAYRFWGRWRDDPRWGNQFTFETYTLDEPADVKGVVTYLVNVCRNVGQATAWKLWEAYGSSAITTLRLMPERVAEHGYMTLKGACEAAADLQRNAAFEKTRVDLITLFSGRGFGKTAIAACIEKWGVTAAEKVRRNPWLLLLHDIPRSGFRTVDRLYLELGGDPARLKRQMLAGWDALRQGVDGNTWHPMGAFRAGVVAQVGVKDAQCAKAISLGVRAGWIGLRAARCGQVWIAEADHAAAESTLAARVSMLRNTCPGAWPIVSEPAVSAHQAAAWATVATSPVVLLTGAPGTGKTHTAAAVLRQLVDIMGAGQIAVCAPTGKAAVRITEAMAAYKLPLAATTIHRLLEIGRNGHDGKGWDFLFNEGRPLPYRVVVVDEVSMLETDLASSLFRAIAPGSHVLLVGDPHQLPPVGHGAPLRDMIAAGLPCAELTEIKRNAGAIVQACAEIKDGKRFSTSPRLDPDAGANLQLLECADEDAQIDTLRRLYTGWKTSSKRDAVWDIQVLCPMNDKSQVSRVQLNRLLQGILNPAGLDAEAETVGEFRLGDKVICLRNCMLQAQELAPGLTRTDANGYRPALDQGWNAYQHFLANGDLGRVEAVDVSASTLIVKFTMPARTVKVPLGKKVAEGDGGGSGSAGDFALAYAITGHKSQGSEWPIVVVIIDESAGMVSCREWIYTAISRAKVACLLLGKRSVLDRQCSRVTLSKRKTFLKELLS